MLNSYDTWQITSSLNQFPHSLNEGDAISLIQQIFIENILIAATYWEYKDKQLGSGGHHGLLIGGRLVNCAQDQRSNMKNEQNVL